MARRGIGVEHPGRSTRSGVPGVEYHSHSGVLGVEYPEVEYPEYRWPVSRGPRQSTTPLAGVTLTTLFMKILNKHQYVISIYGY